MPKIDPGTIVRNPTWNEDLPDNSLSVFTINDVVLEIPPTSISIQNEDLVWQWKTLRSKASTKISSGRGMCQVTLNVVFTPALLLHLHRLVVQFRHSPFCWVDNKLLRDTLAPHWPLYKQMAFTMTGLHISNLAGHPGSFQAQIDLRWFNYAPYGYNYLFRREWRTRPIVDTAGNIEQTIPRLVSTQDGDQFKLIPEVIQFTAPDGQSALRPWSPISFNSDIHGGYTLQQLKENHLGEVFDLLPLPTRMKPSSAVGNPAHSNIYVRYINSIQQLALSDNFGIDVYVDLIDPGASNLDVSDPNHPWNKVTWGENKGAGLVKGLHSAAVPQKVRSKWIGTMLQSGKNTAFQWEEYISLDLGAEINQSILDFYKDLTAEKRTELAAAAEREMQPRWKSSSTNNAFPLPVERTINPNRNYFEDARPHPIHTNTQKPHFGVDFSDAEEGDECYAIHDGVIVSTAESTTGWGKRVEIAHLDGTVKTLYAHLSNNSYFNVGDEVTVGQVIGLVGSTGDSTGPHLHFEVMIKTDPSAAWRRVDPEPWIDRDRVWQDFTQTASTSTPDPLPPEESEVEEIISSEITGAIPTLTEEQKDEYAEILGSLYMQGYHAYEGDMSVSNCYRRVQTLSIGSENWDGDEWDPNNIGPLGTFVQHDAVVTSVSGSLGHIVASIPIIGHEYPTHQHLGSIEPTYGIEITCIETQGAKDGLSKTGQLLQGMRSKLQENARTFRLIPGAECLSVSTFMTRLLGTRKTIDFVYNGEDASTDLVKRAMISRSATQTIEGAPGSVSVYFDIQETNPFQTEALVESEAFGNAHINTDETHKQILKALEVAGTSTNLDDLASKQTMMSLGQEIVGIDALRDMDGLAADYFESLPSDGGGRTFLMFEAEEHDQLVSANEAVTFSESAIVAENRAINAGRVCSDADPRGGELLRNGVYYDVSDDAQIVGTGTDTYDRYKAWAENNGILNAELGVTAASGTSILGGTTQPGATGRLGLNIQDLTDHGMELFGSNSYQGYQTNMLRSDEVGYGTSKLYGEHETIQGRSEFEEARDLMAEGLIGSGRIRKYPKFYVLETTNYSRMQADGNVSDKVEQYALMLSLIKKTADIILAEEELNSSSTNFANTNSAAMAYTKSEIRELLYDLEVTPSMWGAFMSVWAEQYSGGFGNISLVDWDRIPATETVYQNYPWMNLQSRNPDTYRWMMRSTYTAYYGFTTLGNTIMDSFTNILGSVWNNTGLSTLLTGGSGGRWGAANGWLDFSANQHWEMNARKQDHASDAYNRYVQGSFPLSFWTTLLKEEYFDGIKSSLGVAYASESLGDIQVGGSEASFGLDTFLGGFSIWFASDPTSMKWWIDNKGGITSGFKSMFREYNYAALAASAGIEIPRMENVLTSEDPTDSYLRELPPGSSPINWDDIRHWPIFSTLGAEQTKVLHIKSLLKKLAEQILQEPDVLEHLGVEWNPAGHMDVDSNSTGVSCYPDLDLPDHPYYGESLYAMSPDFYYWNIYDDATGTLSKELLEHAEEAIGHAIQGPYDALKSMQKEGMDPSEYAEAYNHMDIGDGTLTPSVTRLVSQHEASDSVHIPWRPNSSSEPIWIDMGPTHQNVAGVNIFNDAGEISQEWVAFTQRGEAGFTALQAEVDKITDDGKKEIAQQQLDDLKEYTTKNQIYPPLLNQYHGNPLYRPNGPEMDYYKDLIGKVKSTEVFFGSRLGYVGGHSTGASDAAEGLTDTRLASLDEYNMTFSPSALKRLAVDSSKDILSQKYSMKRAFPTFKLFFVEEDAIYNRILSFDDFHAFNGVKEFTVHQSRKNPADTATIVLQNVSGTLDGTKRGVITDVDYFKQDDSGNYIDPSEHLDDTSIEAGSSSSGEPAVDPNASSEAVETTNKNWERNSSQPFQAVILRPGLNVQLRAGYSNDPGMLSVMISGRVTDVQWNTNGDLVEITVQSFGTELVKYLKGRSDTINLDGEDEDEVYPTTHQLLGSLMLHTELKHFGRWKEGGIYQFGETKDSTVDFTEYTGKSFFENFARTNGMLRWIYENKAASAAIMGTAWVFSMTPMGRGVRVAGAGLLGSVGSKLAGLPYAGRVIAGAGAVGRGIGYAGSKMGAGRVGRFIGTRIMGGRAYKVMGANGALGSTKLAINVNTALAASGRAMVGGDFARVALTSSGAFNGVVGQLFLRSYNKVAAQLLGAISAGNASSVATLSAKLINIEKAAIYSHAQLLQFGIGKTSANLVSGIGFRSVVSSGARGAVGLTFVGIPFNAARLAAVTATVAGTLELGYGSISSAIYNNTMGRYRRNYAITRSRLMVSPQDDNLYPPSPKDYMDFDYTSFWESPSEWAKKLGKKVVFGGAKTLLFAAGVADEGGVFAEDESLSKWYEYWNGGSESEHVLEKRVNGAQTTYALNNSTIWDVFYEMTLRHPGWVFGARPYGTRFRYTMFFGVPSQRYWAKPASNNFIHRINKLRHYLAVGISEDSFKLLYGENQLEGLKADLRTQPIQLDDPMSYFSNSTTSGDPNFETFETYEDAEADSLGQYDNGGIGMYAAYDLDGDGYDDYLGTVSEIEAGESEEFNTYSLDNPWNFGLMDTTLGDRDAVSEEVFNQHLKLSMTNRALEEYLLGLEQRFVPFRRYHYITSDADIVSNGIIASNKNVTNAVSVLYRMPDATRTNNDPSGVVEMKASTFIPEEDIQMAPISFPNCKGYTMGLRYGLGALLYGMREMYRGELLVLGNPRIRPWDICILRDEYNDMVGPVEVEAVVHMFSHETGFLTEIKPNAVVMSNEISSYPVLSALQLMCMAVEDNRNAKAGISDDMSGEERTAFVSDKWGEDLRLRYGNIFGDDGFTLDDYMPNYNASTMEQIRSGVDGSSMSSLEDTKDLFLSWVGYGSSATMLAGGAYMASKGYFPKSKGGMIAAGVLSAAAIGGTIFATETAKSTSLQWFLAAPILFAQCIEQETVSIMPLTKNGIPIVAGLSMKDPAMMWRSIFGKLYNYANDTAVGLQDMSWYWNMGGDSWWEKWVDWNEKFPEYRQDFTNSAGGR